MTLSLRFGKGESNQQPFYAMRFFFAQVVVMVTQQRISLCNSIKNLSKVNNETAPSCNVKIKMITHDISIKSPEPKTLANKLSN
jgi:hypothetical protein